MTRRLADLWRGPPNLPTHLKLEWRFVLIRWIGIAIVAPGLLLHEVPPDTRSIAFGVLVVAALYNTIVQRQLRRRHFTQLLGVVTAMGDTFLNIAMLLVLGGGFDSPISLFLVTIVVSIAMRFGYGPSSAAVLLLVAVNAAIALQMGKPLDSTFLFRAAVLLLSALLASFLFEQGRADQAALQASNDELRRAYGDLANAHQELLQIDDVKSGFIANVSHELRTPLTSVLAYSELLLTYDPEPEQQREFVEIIHSESERLTRLIEEVLDISKIESGEVMLQKAPVDIRTVIEASARAYRPMIEARGLAFEVDVPARLPWVEGDFDRLRQIVGNLLGNALKFTSDGRIRLAAEALDGEVLLCVCDTGGGIAPEHHGRIFDKFQQLGDVLTQKPSGTGLGLAICRQLVQVHGGRIWVESDLGEGSTFKVVLPAAPADAVLAPEPAAPQRLEQRALGQQPRLLNAPL
jgi:signal transduction histidine kinase